MLHIGMRHITRLNESCHKCKWVMSHIWMSHVTHMDESCHTFVTGQKQGIIIKKLVQYLPSHIRTSHATHMKKSYHMDESCHAPQGNYTDQHFDRKVFFFRSTCISHMNKTCHTYEGVMSHTWMIYLTRHRPSTHFENTCIPLTHESWLTCVTWMSHVEWVMPQMCHMNEPCHMGWLR